MVLLGIQILGFSLGLLSWVGMIGTCASPEWRKNTQGNTLLDSQVRYEGLWLKCTAFATGQTQCQSYNAFFIGLPGSLQICRGLMIASIALGFIGIFVTLPGLQCTTIGPRNDDLKARIALAGGIFFGMAGIFMTATCYVAFLWSSNEGFDVMESFFIGLSSAAGNFSSCALLFVGTCFSTESNSFDQNRRKEHGPSYAKKMDMMFGIKAQDLLTANVHGIFSGAAVSFYAHGVVKEYYDPVFAKQLPVQLRFEYGKALFIGWACFVAGLLSAAVLFCTSARIHTRSEDEALDGSNAGHKFRPVSILHPVLQQSTIPLRTLHTCSRSEPSDKLLTFESSDNVSNIRKLSQKRKHKCTPLMSHSVHLDKEKNRKKIFQQNLEQSSSSSVTRNVGSQSKQTANSKQIHPLQGPVRSNSGRVKHYV